MSKVEKQYVPKIRFKGFEGEWGNSKLHDLVTSISGNDGRKNLPVLTISAGQGWMDQKDRFSQVIAGKELKNYTLLRKGELSYNKGNSKLAKYGVVFSLKNYEEALVPRVYHSFKVKKNVSSLYIEYLFATKKTDQELGKLITSGARMDGLLNISNTAFMGINICSPSYKEQTQIGDFFQKIDQVIELQQKALDTARAYKQSMLQKMFPQKGEKVPRVRFAGFSGDWKEEKLGNVATIYRGLTYKPTDVVKPGDGIRVLRSSNIDEDILVLNKDDVFVKKSAVKLENIKVGDILITAANGSSRLVGKHAVLTTELQNTVHGGFMLIARTKVPFFINSWMNTFEYKVMLQLVQGGNGAIGNLSKLTLEKCKMHIPKLEEQIQIGNFFQKLDQQIEQQAQKLATYQQLKKAMLQRMFV